jgi:hypothetical protein
MTARLLQWLERLRAWWLAPVLERLEALEERVGTIPGVPKLAPARMWDCGHHSLSGATHGDGRTECLACHQAGLR